MKTSHMFLQHRTTDTEKNASRGIRLTSQSGPHWQPNYCSFFPNNLAGLTARYIPFMLAYFIQTPQYRVSVGCLPHTDTWTRRTLFHITCALYSRMYLVVKNPRPKDQQPASLLRILFFRFEPRRPQLMLQKNHVAELHPKRCVHQFHL